MRRPEQSDSAHTTEGEEIHVCIIRNTVVIQAFDTDDEALVDFQFDPASAERLGELLSEASRLAR